NHLKYASLQQGTVAFCSAFEDFIKRVLLKYYEEDIRRLKSSRESIKNDELVDLIMDGDNVHRALAEKTVSDVMYGNLESWIKALMEVGFEIDGIPSEVTEAF